MKYIRILPLFLFLVQAIFAQGGGEYIRYTGRNGGIVFSITSNGDYYFAGTSWGGSIIPMILTDPGRGVTTILSEYKQS